MKRCSTCKTSKPLTGFQRNRTQRDGLQNQCRLCFRTYSARPEIRARRQAHDKIRYKEKAAYFREWARAKRAANPGWEREKYLKLKYGLTLDEVRRLTEGGCGICGAAITLCIDHDHTTGKVRGVLCNNCNSGLGFLGDTVLCLTKALAYLKGSDCVIGEGVCA